MPSFFRLVSPLERMKPFGDERFDTVEQDFPVEYVQAKPVVW